jgi:hypothetical protein
VSALFNYEEIKENEFNASEYVRSLSNNSKMTISSRAHIKFLPGWKHIMDHLIKTIKNYPIEIEQISDFYAVLDVRFAMLKNSREVYVWRAINEAREESKFICAQCSKDKLVRRSNNTASMFCEECRRNAGALNKTGTWLDKY